MICPWQKKLLFASLLLGLVTCQLSARETAPRVKATNTVALRQFLGREVTVHGRIESTGRSSSGHQFLNFSGKQITVFCPSNVISRFRNGHPADVYRGKSIEVTGTLQQYQGKLQLNLTDPTKIKQLAATSDNGAPRKTVQLKSIGRAAWISPAGLRYQGRDPDGRTRVEHVLRHAQDIPARDGPHGVFDGDRGVVFAVIDEAWQLAQKKKLRPRVDGDRSTYLVFMRRRIGYLGGQEGRRKGNPPLDRVFIVFETNTKNIVTAYPR